MSTPPAEGSPIPDGRLRALLDSVGDAVVSADARSRVLSWNAAAERMFGRPADEVIGRPLTVLMPERYRDAHLQGIARLRATGEPQLVGGPPVEVEGLRADGTEFPVELTLGAFGDGDDEVFTGVLRDISDRRELERFRAAQLAVAAALAASAGVEEAATSALRALCETVGWPLGALWLVEPSGERLHCVALWHEPDAPVPAFESASRMMSLGRGEGLPGRVWASGEAAWIEDLRLDENFPRVRAAGEDGLRAAAGLPLVADGEPIGALEVFDRRLRPLSPPALELLRGVSEQVGQFLHRRRVEEELAGLARELERRRQSERHAREINAHVIHHLVQASEALDRDDVRQARREMRLTLEEASRIVTDLGVEGAPSS